METARSRAQPRFRFQPSKRAVGETARATLRANSMGHYFIRVETIRPAQLFVKSAKKGGRVK